MGITFAIALYVFARASRGNQTFVAQGDAGVHDALRVPIVGRLFDAHNPRVAVRFAASRYDFTTSINQIVLDAFAVKEGRNEVGSVALCYGVEIQCDARIVFDHFAVFNADFPVWHKPPKLSLSWFL